MKCFFKIILLLTVLLLYNCHLDKTEELETSIVIKDSISKLFVKAKKQPYEKARVILFTAIDLSKTIENDSLYFKSINKLAILEYRNTKYHQFKKYSEKLVKVAFEKKDTLYLAKGFFNLGSYYSRISKIDSSYYHFNEAKRYYLAIKDSAKVGSCLLNMSIIQTGVGDYYGSENTIKEALSYVEQSTKTKTKRSLYNNFGVTSYELKDYKNGLYWYEKALALTKLPSLKAIILNNIGVIYRDMGNYKEAIVYFKKALENDLKKQSHTQAMLIDNIGYVYFLEKKSKALQKLQTAFTIRKGIESQRGRIVSKLHLAEYYLYKKDTGQAFTFLKTALIDARKIKDVKNRLKILALLSDNISNRSYKEELEFLKDSVFLAERTYRQVFAKIRYRTEQKENEYDFLQTQFIEQTSFLEDQEQKKISFAILFGVSLVLLIIGIYLFNQRKKIHQQQLLIEKLKARAEEKQAISIHLHDAIAGDILLGLQHSEKLQKTIKTQEFTTLISIFERAYEKARKISQDLSQLYFQKTAFAQKITNLCIEYSFHNDIKIIHQGIQKISWDIMIDEVKIAIFGILQEALTNVLKHADASEVLLTFDTKDKILSMIISDNGLGNDIEKNSKGIGLLNMQKRVEDLEGTITFKSNKPTGTTVNIEIPMLTKNG